MSELKTQNEALRNRVNELEEELISANQMRLSETFKCNNEIEARIQQIKDEYK